MKSFIGRVEELDTLEHEYERDSGFVVVYGRRRVGKTTLIKEFIKDKNALYFLATEEIEKGNIKRFTETLSEFTNQNYLKNVNFNDWEDLFKIFSSYKPESKKILVIDEFQYLANINSAFPSIFQRIWDEILKNSNVMVILCGSLISMMVSQVLSYDSPLYGRRTSQIRLKPLKFTELFEENTRKTFEELVETYAVTGGVPKYFEFFDNNKLLMDNIKQEVLRKSGFLYEEPVFLLEKEVKETVTYFSIIKSIAVGNHKIGKIAGNLEFPTNKISPYLKTLIDLNLIEKRVPVTEKNPKKSRKGLYYIDDNFINFWFKFVYPYKGELELDNIEYVLSKIKNNFIDNHVSFIYEDICKQIFIKLCIDKTIDFIPSKIGSYWNSNIEIDVAALDEENKYAVIGECKYYTKPVDADIYFELKKKVLAIPELKDYKKTYALFSKSGFSKKLFDLETDDLLLINEMEIVKRNN